MDFHIIIRSKEASDGVKGGYSHLCVCMLSVSCFEKKEKKKRKKKHISSRFTFLTVRLPHENEIGFIITRPFQTWMDMEKGDWTVRTSFMNIDQPGRRSTFHQSR